MPASRERYRGRIDELALTGANTAALGAFRKAARQARRKDFCFADRGTWRICHPPNAGVQRRPLPLRGAAARMPGGPVSRLAFFGRGQIDMGSAQLTEPGAVASSLHE